MAEDVFKFGTDEVKKTGTGMANSAYTITSEQLKPATPLDVPKPQMTGSPDALAGSLSDMPKSLDEYVKALTPPETALDKQNQAILDSIAQLTGDTTGRQQYQFGQESKYGVPQLTQQLNDLKGQLITGDAEYAKMVADEAARSAALENQPGVSTRDVQGAQGALARTFYTQKAAKAADLALIAAKAQAVSGNINTALLLAQKATDAKFQPIEDELKVKRAQLDAIQPMLDKQEKIQFAALQRQYEDEQMQIAEAKASQKAIGEMVVNALAQGAPQEIVDQASKAKTSLEASKILGKYSGEFLKYEMLKEQIKTEAERRKTERAQQANYAANIRKTNAEIDALKNPTPGTIPSQYQGALDVILGSDKLTKDQKASVINSIANGQNPTSVIKNKAKDIMGQTNATKLDNYETAKQQLVSVQDSLKTYYAKGGKTNVFSGNYEKAINKLGEVKDPELVEIATQIAASLQIYRNAVSGTAYSVQEGKDIASIFPGIDKSEGLNTAILNGRMKAFDTTIDASYRNVLGPSYDAVLKAGVASDPNNPFNQALGGPQTPVPGTSILGGLNPDGTLNFVIP